MQALYIKAPSFRRFKDARLAAAVVFYLLFWAATYALLYFVKAHAFVLGSDVDHLDPLGLLLFLLFCTAACGAAWLLVEPTRIVWQKRAWWPYPLIALGFAIKAFTLPASQVLIALPFYVFTIGFTEEFLFRGCLEEGLSALGPRVAVIVTGLLFGLSHAPQALLDGALLHNAILSNLGGGLLAHLVFRWLRDRGGLALPILVHGLLGFLGAGLP